jgi:hypothetical protein
MRSGDDGDSLMCTDSDSDEDDDVTGGMGDGGDGKKRSKRRGVAVIDRTVVRLSGVNISVVGVSRCTPLMRAPAAAEATVWRRLGAAPASDSDDSPATVLRADVAPMQLDISAEDFRLLCGCVAANLAEKPEVVPVASNPILVVVQPRGRDPTQQRTWSVTTAPLVTLAEGAEEEEEEKKEEEEEEAEAKAALLQTPQPRHMSRLARLHPHVVPEGPTVVTTRVSVRVTLMELALYRGGGRGEPLAVLSLHSLAADIALLAPDTTTVHASVAGIALEDLRGGGGTRRPVAFGGCLGHHGGRVDHMEHNDCQGTTLLG